MSLLAAIVFVSAVAGTARADDDTKKAVAELQGEWKVLSFTKLKRDLNANKNGKVVIAGNEMTASVNGDTDVLTLTLYPKANPPALDMKVADKATVRGIYKLEKGKLTICFGGADSVRPTEFKVGENNSLMVLERVNAPARTADAPPKAAPNLQGEWKVLTFNKLGRDNPDVVEKGKIVIADDTLTFSVDGEDTALTSTLDPSASPQAIDWKQKPAGKKTIRGIYKLDKDKLTICFGIENSARPTEFKSSKDDSIMVLERVKK